MQNQSDMVSRFHQMIRTVQRKGVVPTRLVLLAVLGVLCLAAGNWLAMDRGKEPVTEKTAPQQAGIPLTQPHSYEESLEIKLASVLTQVKGAGNVKVTVTLESGATQEYAKNSVKENKVIQEKDTTGGIRTTTESRETEQLTFAKDGSADRPVMLREVQPVIKGVLVIADGAGDSHVKAQLAHAVEGVLGLPLYRITVLPQRR